MTIEERLNKLKNGSEVHLAIEGRYTNLRIFTGKDANGKHHFNSHDTVYLRLDKANEYSAPLDNETINYLINISKVAPLLEFGFKSNISNLVEILSITESFKDRDCISW